MMQELATVLPRTTELHDAGVSYYLEQQIFMMHELDITLEQQVIIVHELEVPKLQDFN